LGEVHVLGFDPNNVHVADLAWTHEKLHALAYHAKQRGRSVALPLGHQNPDDARTYAVRASLSKLNQTPWVLFASVMLLAGYAFLAGPLNFARARRERAPLAVLPRLVALSAAAFGLVLALSYFTKSGRPRARHLSLIEAGAAMPRAAITRFRAFSAESYAATDIGSTEADSAIAPVSPEHDTRARIVQTAAGTRLERVTSKAWKTLLLREEGIVDLGSGIALTLDQGTLTVSNRSNRDLLGVVVRAADGQTYFYDVIHDGERLAMADSNAVQVIGAPARAVHFPLLIHNFDWRMDELSPGLAVAWRALEALRPGEVDWWPPDVPVLLGQLSGGEGRATDSGYPIESDRVLLRVVGYGGNP
jgi:hypothetical protein